MGYTVQSKGDGVTVKQGTNHPKQVDTIISQKGEKHHVHVATSKKTGEPLFEGWRINTPKKKK